MLKLLIKYLIDDPLLTVTTNNTLFNEKLHKHSNMLFPKNFKINWNYTKNIIVCIIYVMQLMLDVIFKALKSLINKNKDKKAFFKIKHI